MHAQVSIGNAYIKLILLNVSYKKHTLASVDLQI